MDLTQFTARLVEARHVVADALAAGLHAAADDVLAQAKSLAPVDTGALRNSGQVSVDPEALRARIAFTAGHAVAVHEMTSNHHTRGQAHYLIDPLVAARRTAPATVAEHIRSAL